MTRLPILTTLPLSLLAALLCSAAFGGEPPAPGNAVDGVGEPDHASLAPGLTEVLVESVAQAAQGTASDALSAMNEAAGALSPPAGARSVVVRSTFFPLPEPEPPAVVLGEAEIAPWFEDEPWRTARARLEEGRPAEALAGMPEALALTPPQRYLRALALSGTGQHAPAAEAFAALAAEYPALANRCRHHAGLAFESAGALERAAGMFREVVPDSALGSEARRALARVLQRAGDLQGAIAVLAPTAARPAPAWGWDEPGDTLFEVAQMQQSLGERRTAAASFLKVWAEHPRARHASRALERARALKAEPTVEHRVARGELLVEYNRSTEAIALLAPVVESPPASLSEGQMCRARFAMGKAHRKQRKHAQALALLQPVVDKCARDELWARAVYLAGTSASIVDLERGVGFYRLLAEQLPDHSFADDSLFFVAELSLRLGRVAEARAALQRLAKLYPRGDYHAEGLFKLFWLERSEKRFDEALGALERIERDHGGTPEGSAAVERAQYWRGRTLWEQGRDEEALAAYESLAASHPTSYYATLARSRLSDSAPLRAAVLAARFAVAPEPPAEMERRVGAALAADPRFVAGLELLRMGFYQEAQAELLSIDRARLRESEPPDGLRLIVELLARSGQTRRAHAMARTYLKSDLTGPLEPATMRTWQAAFPLAFREPIERHARSAGVDPDLLQALIREESALDPKVHSWAGAIGLCQLMPPTAREVAGWLKVKGPLDATRLHDPDLNIQLGATYLGSLLKRFKGNVALSLAAYNAGGGSVNRWLREVATGELDEFVEEIPIHETRNYVKRVLGSYAAYQLLYGRGVEASVLGMTLVASK